MTLPAVFAKMPFGAFFSFLFFLLLFFAAVTSAMSLLEVATTFAIEKFNLKRSDAVWIMSVIIILLGGYSAISLSGDPKVVVGAKTLDFFDAMDYLANNVCLPIGSFFLCIFVGWVWLDPACKQLTNDGTVGFSWMTAWVWCVRIISPVGIAFVFLSGIGVI
jgi:NSS family neurotransmitter:Na+ symporter